MEKTEEMDRKNKFNLDSLSAALPSSSEDKNPIRKLYISNFRGKIYRKNLQKTFAVYGQVLECRGPFVNVRGHSFCFITYLNPEDAAKALEAGQQKKVIYKGHALRTMPSFPDTQPSESDVKRLMKKHKIDGKLPNNNSKENENQKEEGIDYINQVDDDCLINIFTYLPIPDRMRIERVCKRWQAVGPRSWHNIKSLELSQQLLRSAKRSKKIKNRAIENIIERCGRFLLTLNFCGSSLGCNSEVLLKIGEHCQNLTRLSLQLQNYRTKELTKLLSQVKKVKYLEIRDIGKNFKTEILIHLSHDSIEEVRLATTLCYETFEPTPRPLAAGVFRRLKNLRSVTLNGFILKPENVKLISEKPHLTYLSLPNCCVKKNLNKLTSASKLEHLNVAKVLDVDNSFLISIALQCNELRYLNISDCTSISIAGISALANLPKLEVLIMNEIYEVTDETLSRFVNLHELHCESCEQVADPGIITLLETAPNLRFLNLYNTAITSALINTADAVTKIRTNGVKLFLKVSSTVLDDWEGVPDPSPLLDIEGKDDTVSDISDEYLYDDDEDEDNFWDLGIDDYDEYDDEDLDDFEYNGGNPFFLF